MVFIAMEYVAHGSLDRYCHHEESLPEFEVQQIAYQVSEGLSIMHSNSYVHRNVKPDVCLFSLIFKSPSCELSLLMGFQSIFVVRPGPNWWVKVGNFGISKAIRSGKSTVGRWDTEFIPPESQGFYPVEDTGTLLIGPSPAEDIWGLGQTIVVLLTGECLFRDANSLLQYVVGRAPLPVERVSSTKEARNFLARAMAASPLQRFSAKDAVSHPWLHGSLRPSKPSHQNTVFPDNATNHDNAGVDSQKAGGNVAGAQLVAAPSVGDSGYGTASKTTGVAPNLTTTTETNADDAVSVLTDALSLNLPLGVAKTYAEAFATKLADELLRLSSLDTRADHALLKALPSLLRAFALRLSTSESSPTAAQVATFTRKHKE